MPRIQVRRVVEVAGRIAEYGAVSWPRDCYKIGRNQVKIAIRVALQQAKCVHQLLFPLTTSPKVSLPSPCYIAAPKWPISGGSRQFSGSNESESNWTDECASEGSSFEENTLLFRKIHNQPFPGPGAKTRSILSNGIRATQLLDDARPLQDWET